jgi:hypothetical protein
LRRRSGKRGFEKRSAAGKPFEILAGIAAVYLVPAMFSEKMPAPPASHPADVSIDARWRDSGVFPRIALDSVFDISGISGQKKAPLRELF